MLKSVKNYYQRNDVLPVLIQLTYMQRYIKMIDSGPVIFWTARIDR